MRVPSLVEPAIPHGAFAALDQPVLTADDLTLRPWVIDDATALSTAYEDPGIQQWHARTMTNDEAVEWIESRPVRWAAEAGADWAVVDAGELVGRVGLRTLVLDQAQGEAAYWVLPSARGRGIAATALSAMNAWLFATAGLHRLVLAHSTRNSASCRVAAKAGFALEGTMRSDLLHGDGWHDMHLHARVGDPPPSGTYGSVSY